jgi:hypothetical protein
MRNGRLGAYVHAFEVYVNAGAAYLIASWALYILLIYKQVKTQEVIYPIESKIRIIFKYFNGTLRLYHLNSLRG